MRLLPWLVLCTCAVSATAQSHNVTRRESGSDSGKRVVCYYTNWSVYRPGTAKFSPQNINPYLCTHLIYAFGGLTRENSLRPYDKYQDIEQGGYAKFTGLKTYNKNLKTMLAIGGWNEGSTRFSPLVADDERRAEMVHNIVRFLRQNHFDGLDLDWEYPAFRDGGKPRDRENYALFVQELRSEFDRESDKTGRPRLLLTMAVPAGIEYIDKGYDIPKLNRYLDFMNILSYDYHSAFEPAVNHHSPLYPLEEDSEYNFDAQLSIDYTISHYLKLGADRDKLVLGIPTYGRSYTLFNPLATEIGAPADGPGEQGDATREKGYLAYYEICDSLKSDDWKVEHPNPEAMGPYAFKGNQWVGYDDIDIVKLKSRYVSENGLGGIMFWSIDNDDFRGKCHGRPYPLIEAGKEALLAASSSSNDVVSVAPSRGSSKTRQRRPPTGGSTSNGRQGPQSSPQRPHKKRPSSSSSARRNHDKVVRSTTTTTTTTTTPKYNYPQTTPEPPTTPDPGSDFMCKDEGFFPHPRDCKKYFWCLDSGPSNLGIVAHQFTCPSGLFFNKGADSCDYARNVICKKKSASTTTTTKAPTETSTAKSTTKFVSTTTRKTTKTTTTTPEPIIEEEEYDDEEYDDEEAEAEEDPQSIKELINLIKKLGGVEQLEKQLHLQGPEQDSKSGQVTTSGFSRSLYDRVLSRNANNRAISGGSSTTPRYSSVYRNRPVRPQNEGLEELDEVKALRREKPQYVTIRRDRPATAAPEEDDVIDEEEAYQEATNEELNRGDRGRSQVNPVEYVTIRRNKPSTSSEPDVTTPSPRYSTIQRSRKPSSDREVGETDREPEVQDVTTEIRPVYIGPTERNTEQKIQIVTPSRPATEKAYRKFHREDILEPTTTPEPERKVSAGRPQYVDITNFRRHSNVDSTSPIPPPEEEIPYIEINSLNRRRNAQHNDVVDTEPPPPPPPFPTPDSHNYPKYVDINRHRGPTTPHLEETEQPSTIPENVDRHSGTITTDIDTTITEPTQPKYVNILPRRRGTTTSTTETITTTTEQHKTNSRRRPTTIPTTYTTPVAETHPQDTDIDTIVQTLPPPTTYPTVQTTPPSSAQPETLPPPTSTKFTPTVTRVITSVTESGTTERQRIAINRVPYIAIAALRGETVYPGPVFQSKGTTPLDKNLLPPTSPHTVPNHPESTTTNPAEQKTERVMEVNRITLVTLKEELPVGFTQSLPGNETTERIVVDLQSEKKMNKISEVNRVKYVTMVDNGQTTLPNGEYTTAGEIGEIVSTQPTPVGQSTDSRFHENDVHLNDIRPVKPEYIPSTDRVEQIVTETVATTETSPTKLVETTVGNVEELSSTDPSSSSATPINRRRRPSVSRTPGVDDYKKRRTRPPYTRSTTEVPHSSTQSSFSQKRRGQRKPYKPTSTTAADEELPISPRTDDVSSENRSEEPKRSFVPKRGQRKRPSVYRPTLNKEESIQSGRENSVLFTSERTPSSSFSPRRGNRRRTSTAKPTTETTSTVHREETTEVEVKELDEILTTLPIDSTTIVPKLEEIQNSSTESHETSTRPRFSPKKSNRNRSSTTEASTLPVTTRRGSSSATETPEGIETSISTESETKFEFTNVISDTAATTDQISTLKEIVEGTTFRPSSLASTTDSTRTSSEDLDSTTSSEAARRKIKLKRRRPVSGVPTSTTENTVKVESITKVDEVVKETTNRPSTTRSANHRVAFKQVRRRPVHSNLSKSTTESSVDESNESRTTVRDSLNEIASDHSISDSFETSVTPFATDALLERDNYDITTARTGGAFITTVDREGKRMVKISILNNKAAVQKTQESSKIKNDPKDIETSESLRQSTLDDSDLDTDTSGYASVTGNLNSIQTVGASVKSSSEEVDDDYDDVSSETPVKDVIRKHFKSSAKHEKDFFNASVDFTTDAVSSTTKRPVPGKKVPFNSSGPDRRPLRRKRPSSTLEPQSEAVSTTTSRPVRRPTNALFSQNRIRQRATTTTTTTTTEAPTTSASNLRRKPGARVVRRRKYGSTTTNRTRDSDATATASEVEPSETPADKDTSGGRVRKYSFPRRKQNTTSAPTTTTPPNDTQGELQLLESKDPQVPDLELEDEDPNRSTKLPDLANSAVVAIHNLATASPGTQSTSSTTTETPDIIKTTRFASEVPQTLPIVSSTPATAALYPRRGSTLYVSNEHTSPVPSVPPPRRGSTLYIERHPTASPAPLPSPRRLPGSVTLKPRPFSKTPAASSQSTSSRPKTSRAKLPPIIDYEYYDDDEIGILDVAPVSGKVKIHSDGYIECLDRGNFPHPFSCKKFISCAKMENGDLLGWEYTCPRQLSFDPIGGICNWSAGLGCKE